MNASQVSSFSNACTSRHSTSFKGGQNFGVHSLQSQQSRIAVSDGTNSLKINQGLGSSVRESFQELNQSANAVTYIAIIIAMMGALMFGIDQGNYGLVQDFHSFYDYWCKPYYLVGGFDCQPGDHGGVAAPGGWVLFKSWGGSLITLGACAGCTTVAPLISSKCGRRPCISVGGIVCFVGCLFASYWAFNSTAIFYIGRFVTGFGAGICCFALPIYSSEVATPSIRGLMGSFFQLFVVVGGVLASIILASLKDWRMGMLLPGIAGAIVSCLVWITPESPRYVMGRRGYEAGRAELQKVRRGDVEQEAQAIRDDLQKEAGNKEVSYRELFQTPGLRLRVFIAMYLAVAQQLTGVNAFLSYTTSVFEAAGIPSEQINALPGYAIYFNLAMLAGCILGLLLIDSPYGGRRSQLLGATCMMGPTLIIAGIAKANAWPSWIPVVMLFLYGPGFQVAWGIIPWVYPSEIFSMAEKDKAVSMATFSCFFVNFIVNMTTEPLLQWCDWATFLIFGCLNVTNFFFVLFFIRETKGVALEMIPRLFSGQQLQPLVSVDNVA
jgi:sugar porter (SP) family MFS transporter